MNTPTLCINTPENFDHVARGLAKTLNLKPTQVKSGIARYKQFSTIPLYTDALTKLSTDSLQVSVSQQAIDEQTQAFVNHIQNEDGIEALTLSSAQVDSVDELTMDHWEGAENAIEESLEPLIKSTETAKAIALLQAAGLDTVASGLIQAVNSAAMLAFLKENV